MEDTTEGRVDKPEVLAPPPNPECEHEKAGVLKYTFDIRRYSLTIKPIQDDTEKYLIEFIYDAYVDGR